MANSDFAVPVATPQRNEFEALAYKARAVRAMADMAATLAATGDVEGLKQHSLSTFLLDLQERTGNLVDRIEKLEEEEEARVIVAPRPA